MASEEHAAFSVIESSLSKTDDVLWKQEMEQCESQLDALQVKSSIEGSEESKKEPDILWRRVKTAAAFLEYLKARAMIMVVDKKGVPLSPWSRYLDFSSFGSLDEEVGCDVHGVSPDENDGAYVTDLLKSVEVVTNVMEALLKRVLIAESETAVEREREAHSREEIRKKETQIESMSFELEEMERVALCTNGILNEMRQRVEDLIEEITKQRDRAAENEQELSRLKRDFESLRSYVSSLNSVRETLISSEKQFQTMEKLFERLVTKTTQLEAEKAQREAEVQKLMEENVRLHTLLDKKEAQLLAMNEQCKVLALSASNV